MFQKIIMIMLTLSIAVDRTYCAHVQNLKIEPQEKIENQKKRKMKIILATVIAAAASIGTTLAIVNLMPNHCPTFLRKYTPDLFIKNKAQLVYTEQDIKTRYNSFSNYEKEYLKKMVDDYEKALEALQQQSNSDIEISDKMNAYNDIDPDTIKKYKETSKNPKDLFLWPQNKNQCHQYIKTKIEASNVIIEEKNRIFDELLQQYRSNFNREQILEVQAQHKTNIKKDIETITYLEKLQKNLDILYKKHDKLSAIK